MSVGKSMFCNCDYPSIYHLIRPAMWLVDSKALCFLVYSGGTDLGDGSGSNSICQWQFHTLP